MNSSDILNFMQSYIARNTPYKEIADISAYQIKELLINSLDTVDFAMDLHRFFLAGRVI
ncbi:hypothetical protein [Methylotuvimicrobium alcaliphilum]|uniref:Uncharacterized protein n=1 Tax=Methylotuvimicrobium alcaliphilum (strain DSM 19304 / NCIMB 14124 / VKM B-2133 / 20Z) TaxID=1091494 RepID=G4SUN8_META2|nr:hypothetical protein [Methylotuvimicrobium alcaliphilum]CCE22865.1 protein of unknown function [Methylotuvimicrobium alcaliphilum 20Z]